MKIRIRHMYSLAFSILLMIILMHFAFNHTTAHAVTTGEVYISSQAQTVYLTKYFDSNDDRELSIQFTGGNPAEMARTWYFKSFKINGHPYVTSAVYRYKLRRISYFHVEVKQNLTTSPRSIHVLARDENGTLIKDITITQAAHVHTYGDWIEAQAPTSTSPGISVRVCSGCGNTEQKQIEVSSGHKHSYIVVNESPATCDKEGYITLKCQYCSTTMKQTTSSRKGHVYIQEDDGLCDDIVGSTRCSMKCARCNRKIQMNDSSHYITDNSDIYMYYARPDGSHGFKSQAMSKVNDKLKKSANNRDIYVFRLHSSHQFGLLWNTYIPKNVHNIYYYGHQDSNATLEFLEERLSLEECFDTEIRGAKSNSIALKNKNVSGEVYIFTCNAGTRAFQELNFDKIDNIFDKVKDGKSLTSVFAKNFSTLRFFAYICPGCDVIGIKDDSIDYDGEKNGVIMPTSHSYILPGQFVAEHYNSTNNCFETTHTIGYNSAIADRYYAS